MSKANSRSFVGVMKNAFKRKSLTGEASIREPRPRIVSRERGTPQEDGAETAFAVDAITIHVGKGDSAATFTMRRDVLAYHSDFFKAALDIHWKDNEVISFALQDEDPALFEAFANFLTSGQTASSRRNSKAMSLLGVDQIGCEWKHLSNLWLMGERLASTSFKDAVVDAITTELANSGSWPVDMHEDIYPKSSESSPIRRLLVDITIWSWKIGTFSSCAFNSQWAEFFYDCTVALDRVVQIGHLGKAPYLGDVDCRYHEHAAEGKPCYKSMFGPWSLRIASLERVAKEERTP